MSAVREKSVESTVAFVAINTGHDVSSFDALTKELTQEYKEHNLTNLDGSEKSKEIAEKLQAYITQNGGSSMPPSIEDIEAADDEAVAEAEPANEKSEAKEPAEPETPAPAIDPLTKEAPAGQEEQPVLDENGNVILELEDPARSNGYEGIEGVPEFSTSDEEGTFGSYKDMYGAVPDNTGETESSAEHPLGKIDRFDTSGGTQSGYDKVYGHGSDAGFDSETSQLDTSTDESEGTLSGYNSVYGSPETEQPQPVPKKPAKGKPVSAKKKENSSPDTLFEYAALISEPQSDGRSRNQNILVADGDTSEAASSLFDYAATITEGQGAGDGDEATVSDGSSDAGSLFDYAKSESGSGSDSGSESEVDAKPEGTPDDKPVDPPVSQEPNVAEIELDENIKPPPEGKVDLSGDHPELPLTEENFINDMKANMAPEGTTDPLSIITDDVNIYRDNIQQVTFYMRDKATGKPVGKPYTVDAGSTPQLNEFQTAMENKNQEIYGVSLTFKDGKKAWTSPTVAKEQFGRIVDIALTGARWIHYTVTKMTEPVEETAKKDWWEPKHYTQDKQDVAGDKEGVVLETITDLGEGRWSWALKDGTQRYGDKADIPHVIVQFEWLDRLKKESQAKDAEFINNGGKEADKKESDYALVAGAISRSFNLVTGEDKLVMSNAADVEAEDIRTDVGNLLEQDEENGTDEVRVSIVAGEGDNAVYAYEADGNAWLIPANMFQGDAYKEFVGKLAKVVAGEPVPPEGEAEDTTAYDDGTPFAIV
jgi:hypothetical protein